MNALAQYRRFRSLQRSQWLDRVSIRKRQDARLQALVDHAYSHVPYYRTLFNDAGLKPEHIRSCDDLEKIPITTKATLQQLEPAMRTSEKFTVDTLTREHTSGSTGQPFTSYFDPHFVATRNGLFLCALHAAGYRLGQKLLLIAGEEKKAKPWMRWRYASIERPATDLVAELNHFRPAVLYGCTTPLRSMAEHVRLSGKSCHRPKVVISTAETLDQITRKLIETVLGAKVFDIYGLTEMGMVAWECPAHDGYHVSEDTVIVEFAEHGDAHSSDLVMTNLELTAMPLIRFQTGDIATPMADGTCRCGRALRRIQRIEGRSIDCLRFNDGKMITPYRLTLALEQIYGLGRYQILQKSPDRCVIRIESTDDSQPAMIANVRQALAPVLGELVQMEVVFEGSVAPPPGQKFRIVINETDR